MRASLALAPLLLIAHAAPALAAHPGVTAATLAAATATGAVVLAAALGWRLRHLGARLRDFAARNARLGASNLALRQAVDRAEARSRMLDGVMAAMSDGIAVVDADLRIVGWNSRFPEVTGVPRKALRIGMPFAEAVRLQAEAGEFGLVDPEAETARRLRLLRNGPILERWRRERPDGSIVELRRAPLPGGGFVTVYTPVAQSNAPPYPTELGEAFRSDWAARLPRLTAAAADGDLPGLRACAHALRGIAANAGWMGAVTTLVALEAAVQADDVRAVRSLAAMLTVDDPW